MRGGALGLLIAVACRPGPPADAPVDGSAPAQPAAAAEPASTPEPEAEPDFEPPTMPTTPAIVVHNKGGAAIEIYGAYVVDRDGKVGTRALWPHPSDCPDVKLPSRKLPDRGLLVLPAPVEAYTGDSCKPVPLPAGDYVLRLESGYGEGLYAAAPITLPLAGPVELTMENHEAGPPCDPALARRAARLALAAARAEGSLPKAMERACDPKRARCGTLPLESKLPPPKCTVTLHERLLRIEMAAADDAPRWLDAWTDFEVTYAQRPEVDRTSASRVDVGGKSVVIAGMTSRHRHEHGGDAAGIGSASFLVGNPFARPLKLHVRGVEFLTDSECGLPNEVHARPKPDRTTIEVPPGTHEIEVGFAGQSAYQAHCDRFATRVKFEVEGKRLAASVEHEVMRFEPIRRER